ncbi:hypothetical protein Q9189_002237 [Teloschistes chrysophthalmus]
MSASTNAVHAAGLVCVLFWPFSAPILLGLLGPSFSSLPWLYVILALVDVVMWRVAVGLLQEFTSNTTRGLLGNTDSIYQSKRTMDTSAQNSDKQLAAAQRDRGRKYQDLLDREQSRSLNTQKALSGTPTPIRIQDCLLKRDRRHYFIREIQSKFLEERYENAVLKVQLETALSNIDQQATVNRKQAEELKDVEKLLAEAQAWNRRRVQGEADESDKENAARSYTYRGITPNVRQNIASAGVISPIRAVRDDDEMVVAADKRTDDVQAKLDTRDKECD